MDLEKKKLGQGLEGVVRVLIHRKSKRRVATKAIRKLRDEGKDNEAKTHARLKHVRISARMAPIVLDAEGLPLGSYCTAHPNLRHHCNDL